MKKSFTFLRASMLLLVALFMMSVNAFAGDGTKANPYTSEEVIALGNPGTKGVWVKGLIIGSYNNKLITEAAAHSAYTMVLASAMDSETFVIVQLSAIKDDVNLVDNADNLGREIMICGNLEAYYGKTGLKSCSAYEFLTDGGSGEVTPPTTNPDTDTDADQTSGIVFDGSELPTTYPTDGVITVGGVEFTLTNVANFSSPQGSIQFKKGGSYLYNNAAIADLSCVKITLSPAETPYNNFSVIAGTEAHPEGAAIEPAKEGDVCSYTIPTGSTFVTITNASNYAAYASKIEMLTGEVEGGTGGDVVTPDVTPVTIAEFLAAADTESAATLGEVTVTYITAQNLYVKDATGSLLVYDYNIAADQYKSGDVLTNLSGKYKAYKGLAELVKPAFPEAITRNDGAQAPVELTPAEVTEEQVSAYVILKGVEMTENTIGGVASYNKFKIDLSTLEAGKTYDVICVVTYFDKLQLYPISFTEATVSALEEVTASRAIYANNGVLYVSAAAGEEIAVFNIMGQQVANVVATEGLNAIEVANQNVVIVTVEGKAVKVVL